MTNEDAIKKFNKLFPHIREYQKLAKDLALLRHMTDF